MNGGRIDHVKPSITESEVQPTTVYLYAHWQTIPFVVHLSLLYVWFWRLGLDTVGAQGFVRGTPVAVSFPVSFFLPGLGQLYKGQLINGIVWFVFVSMGYVALVVPGLILHFFCVLGALSGNPWSEGKTTVVRE